MSEVYKTERYASSDLTYRIPLKKPGKYVLILKFSEVFFQSPGEKVFDAGLGSTKIVKNIDVFGTVYSRNIPYDVFIPFELKNGKIIVTATGEEAFGAYAKEKLLVRLFKGAADNPKINAILLVSGTLSNTHYDSHKRYLVALNDMREEQARGMHREDEQENQVNDNYLSATYFDDEEEDVGKGMINSFLDNSYMLEMFTAGFVTVFLVMMGSAGKKAK